MMTNHEMLRRKLWIDTMLETMKCANHLTLEDNVKAGDFTLERFDEKFPTDPDKEGLEKAEAKLTALKEAWEGKFEETVGAQVRGQLTPEELAELTEDETNEDH